MGRLQRFRVLYANLDAVPDGLRDAAEAELTGLLAVARGVHERAARRGGWGGLRL